LAESLRHMATTTDNAHALVLADTLDRATERLLNENKSPARKVGQIDNRGSHAFLAYAWAKELAEQTGNPEIAAAFAPVAQALEQDLEAIEQDLVDVQGSAVDLGGYYRPDATKAAAVMRPSERFEAALALVRG
ncbi:MAG TPA: NADP-dependent isocitrate dehydrogenase, partial [Lapillicoccus sp.]|nr:NADP-dependent isocitrate dehydrogenase [Lapillicoccus sp.]